MERKRKGFLKPEIKPKPADGIWLEDQRNYLLFSQLMIEYTAKNYSILADEIVADEDIELDLQEPEGDPQSYAYKLEMKKIDERIKQTEELVRSRYKLFGDIMLRLCVRDASVNWWREIATITMENHMEYAQLEH